MSKSEIMITATLLPMLFWVAIAIGWFQLEWYLVLIGAIILIGVGYVFSAK